MRKNQFEYDIWKKEYNRLYYMYHKVHTKIHTNIKPVIFKRSKKISGEVDSIIVTF